MICSPDIGVHERSAPALGSNVLFFVAKMEHTIEVDLDILTPWRI